MLLLSIKVVFVLTATFKGLEAGLQAPAYAGVTLLTLEDFSFGGTPETQFYRYPNMCKNGRMQTPIDLSPPFTVDSKSPFTLSKSLYTAPPTTTLFNIGHYAQTVDPPGTPKGYARFQGIDYLFTQVHFHTGADNREGSDHTLNGKRFPLEVHVVFRQEKYGQLRDAEKYKDGVIIVGTFYEIGQYNDVIERVVANLPNIRNANQTVNIHPVGSVASLMPDVRSKFYYYDGSLEAPACPETIKWIVWDQPMQLSLNQMNRFRGVLKTSKGSLQVKSWRFTQPRNGRPVYVYPGSSSSSSIEGPMETFEEMFDIDSSVSG